MLKSKFKKFFSIFVVLTVLQNLFVAYAEDVDLEKTGSISITLKAGDTAVTGAELTIYQIAELKVNANDDLNFEYTKAFKGFEGSFYNMENSETIEGLSDYIKSNNITGMSVKTDKAGLAVFKNLPLGLYFAMQTSSAEGFTKCTPFVVSIPTEENNSLIYNVDATPKTNVEKLVDITVKKVWNNGKLSRPDSVTIQLFNGNNLVDTVTLNDKNNWTYTWEKQLQSDGYSVTEKDIPDGYTATYSWEGYDFTVTNTSTLIQTGQLFWPIPVLIISGLVLFALGWALYIRRKKERE